MEYFETITIRQMSDQYEHSGHVLHIDVRIFADGFDLAAEPVSYKLLDREGKILMEGKRNPNQDRSMWRYVELVVEGEFTQDFLSDLAESHPAFEQYRYNAGLEKDLDAAWYRRVVGY